jgi:hypothetical protein
MIRADDKQGRLLLAKRHSSLLGCAVPLEGEFEVDGKSYCLGHVDLEALALLAKLVIENPWPANPRWLLPFRTRLRQLGAGVIFAYVAQQTPYPVPRCLAIWLRGRRGGAIGTYAIASLSRSDDPVQRKEVVRALKRMHAWAALRRIEASEPIARIRRLARQKPPRDYRARMSQFLQHVTPRTLPSSVAGLYENADIDLQGGVPPRSPGLIRAILEHIRTLVRGKKPVPGKTV